MHLLGKIFAWMIVIAAFASVYLASRALAVRNSWTQKLETLKETDAKNTTLLAQKRKELEELQSKYTVVMAPWGEFWTEVDTIPTAQGTLEAALGQADLTFPADSDPLLYAFMSDGQGGSRYMGEFRAATILQDRTAMVPTWKMRPDELQTWRPGPWRYRTVIPAAAKADFGDLNAKFTVLDQRLDDRQANLTMQTQLVAAAQAQLAARQAELLGDAAAPQGAALPAEFTAGLLAATNQEHQQRDAALLEVDRLRRQLKQTYEEFQQLDQQNRGLVGNAPPATAAAAAPTGGE